MCIQGLSCGVVIVVEKYIRENCKKAETDCKDATTRPAQSVCHRSTARYFRTVPMHPRTEEYGKGFLLYIMQSGFKYHLGWSQILHVAQRTNRMSLSHKQPQDILLIHFPKCLWTLTPGFFHWASGIDILFPELRVHFLHEDTPLVP